MVYPSGQYPLNSSVSPSNSGVFAGSVPAAPGIAGGFASGFPVDPLAAQGFSGLGPIDPLSAQSGSAVPGQPDVFGLMDQLNGMLGVVQQLQGQLSGLQSLVFGAPGPGGVPTAGAGFSGVPPVVDPTGGLYTGPVTVNYGGIPITTGATLPDGSFIDPFTGVQSAPLIDPNLLLGASPFAPQGQFPPGQIPPGQAQSGGAGVDPARQQVIGMMIDLLRGVLGLGPSTNASATAGGSGLEAPGSIGNAQLTEDDFLQYVLGGSQGGNVAPDGTLTQEFMNPNSRLANASADELDAVVASIYTAQFKGVALGLDVVFTPGVDDPNVIAANLKTAHDAELSQEAETIAHVAAVYRSDFAGRAAYNNEALGELAILWANNRPGVFDANAIANTPGLGVGDIESVGTIVKMLNEEPDANIRQAWINQIFDFEGGTGNSPPTPNGLIPVPDSPAYVTAIDFVFNGNLRALLEQYGAR